MDGVVREVLYYLNKDKKPPAVTPVTDSPNPITFYVDDSVFYQTFFLLLIIYPLNPFFSHSPVPSRYAMSDHLLLEQSFAA